MGRGRYTMSKGVDILWEGGRYAMCRGFDIPWEGGQYTIGKGVDIPSVWVSIYHV